MIPIRIRYVTYEAVYATYDVYDGDTPPSNGIARYRFNTQKNIIIVWRIFPLPYQSRHSSRHYAYFTSLALPSSNNFIFRHSLIYHRDVIIFSSPFLGFFIYHIFLQYISSFVVTFITYGAIRYHVTTISRLFLPFVSPRLSSFIVYIGSLQVSEAIYHSSLFAYFFNI